jgi:triphosphoribosyl-dephospho-CoA synthetase
VSNLKSAWEIAMEKAKKLDDVTLAELKRKDEERCRLAGRAMAERYFAGGDLRQLAEDLEKYRGEEKELIKSAATSGLVEAISLGDDERLDAAAQGVLFLTGNEQVVEISARIKQLFQQYRQAEKEETEKMDAAGKRTLQQAEISGSAIKAVNSAAREDWKQSLEEMTRPYTKELENYKQEILIQRV